MWNLSSEDGCAADCGNCDEKEGARHLDENGEWMKQMMLDNAQAKTNVSLYLVLEEGSGSNWWMSQLEPAPLLYRILRGRSCICPRGGTLLIIWSTSPYTPWGQWIILEQCKLCQTTYPPRERSKRQLGAEQMPESHAFSHPQRRFCLGAPSGLSADCLIAWSRPLPNFLHARRVYSADFKHLGSIAVGNWPLPLLSTHTHRQIKSAHAQQVQHLWHFRMCKRAHEIGTRKGEFGDLFDCSGTIGTGKFFWDIQNGLEPTKCTNKCCYWINQWSQE